MILILSDDLIDSSKITVTARQNGGEARQCRHWAQVLAFADDPKITQLVIDLQHPECDLITVMAFAKSFEKLVPIVAYGSHVMADRLKEARAANCDEVYTRSQFLK
jgi:CheY-like chemotaxis protein